MSVDIREFLHLCPTLRRYAMALTRNRADSEDLLQDTLERALRYQAKYHGGDLVAWLKTIMFRRFCSDRRRLRVRAEAPQGPAHELAYPCRAENYCALWDMERALGRLSPEQFEAIQLTRIDGLEYQQVAEALGIPLGTVKSRIHRGEAVLAAAVP